MCGTPCGSTPSCDGTCITGKFWGLFANSAADGDPSDPSHFDHIAIHEYATVDPSLPGGCKNQIGNVYDPTGVAAPGNIDDPYFKLGFLGNIRHTDVTDPNACTANDFTPYCSPFN